MDPNQSNITPLRHDLYSPRADNVLREGESMGNARNTVDARNVDAEPRPSTPRKQPAEDEAKGSS